jgi:lambda repressor-like predicted transcriptional regulator
LAGNLQNDYLTVYQLPAMNTHYGQIVEFRVRRNGHNISELARLLNINRRSLYNWFSQQHLKKEYIARIGEVINHNFSEDFPEYFRKEDFEKSQFNNNGFDKDWKDRYINLLEVYNGILSMQLTKDSSN